LKIASNRSKMLCFQL